jgi:hypothetical protein
MDINTPRLPGGRTVAALFGRCIEECRAGIADLPSALRDPAIGKAWLRLAWAAPVVVASFGLLAGYALPPALDAGLNAILPDVTVEKKILGVLPVHKKEANPLIPGVKSGILRLAWIGIGAAGIALALRKLPEAVATQKGDLAGPGTASVSRTTVVKPRGPNSPKSTRALPPHIGPNGRYAIGRELARGGMGIVYSATDEVLGRSVAVKELPRFLAGDAVLVSRFRQEAKALARLTHPNIVQVYDLLEDGGCLWMVIELVEGGDVSSILKDRRRLSAADTSRIGVQVAKGLGYAHAKGVVHRDVKPSNILLTKEGACKIADFGIAKLVGSSGHTVAGEVFGSPSYMSPEQVSGKTVDERSDVYSMGATLYEMLAGRPPFVADTDVGTLSQHLTKEAPSLREHADDVPVELDELVRSMLAKDPERRPRDMEETARRLAPFR